MDSVEPIGRLALIRSDQSREPVGQSSDRPKCFQAGTLCVGHTGAMASRVSRRAHGGLAGHRLGPSALMLSYGFDSDAAFAMLKWWSRNRNIKVRDLAAELMEASEHGAATGQAFRARVDQLLHDLTNHNERQ